MSGSRGLEGAMPAMLLVEYLAINDNLIGPLNKAMLVQSQDKTSHA
jgi:hypothetical protein